MKRKLLIVFVCLAALLVLLWVIGRLTNTFQYRFAVTSANEPTIKTGSVFFSSRFITPDRFDFISYHPPVSGHTNETWVHRLCGLPGDTVEIKNGNLLINNKEVDFKFSLSHNYTAPKNEYEKVIKIIDTANVFIGEYNIDSIIFVSADAIANSKKINAARYIYPADYADEYIEAKYNHKWNVDNFGPVIIPDENYFVLGDSRNSANDSRYIGFIPQKNFVGTILWKK